MRCLIETHDLVKEYTVGESTIHALDRVSLTIDQGEMAAIVGASGSGKSTLMHILGCLDRPDSGTYRLNEENIHELSSDRLAEIRGARVGFVFQMFNLLPRMSALENVELPLQYRTERKARKRAEKALETVGLADRKHHEPNQLSGGQRQRVAIARAIVSEPDIILADEPTGNLDSRSTEEIMDLFKDLHAQGRTIIMVTHEKNIADQCGRRIFMKDGRITESSGRGA